MKTSLLSIATIIIFFIIGQSFAQTNPSDSIDPKVFTDWLTVSAALKSKNIDVAYVNWQVIEPLCLPLKTQDSDVEYNRCRYEKAVLQHLFQLDSATCRQQSVLKLPDSLKSTSSVISTTVTGSDGKIRIIQNTFPPYSDADLKNARNSFYVDCMMGVGWNVPSDWTAGKRQ
jgi:hypothetical protein